MAVRTTIYSDIAVRNRPSFYAPPVAWAAATFVQALIEDEGAIVPDHTGLIVVSDQCSLDTIRELARTAARGMISPLRFAGSSPSIVTGLAALEQGIRGPTLTLTMPPAHAASAVGSLIAFWLRHCSIGAVIAIAHEQHDETRHQFRGLIARSAGDELPQQVQELCGPCA